MSRVAGVFESYVTKNEINYGLSYDSGELTYKYEFQV